jgi:hypothetical protein
MAEQNPSPVVAVKAEETEETKTSAFKQFVTNHPRIAKTAGYTAAALVAVGGTVLVMGRSKEDDSSSSSTDSADYGTFDSSPETPMVAEA